MKVRIQVIGLGETSFTSQKSGRVFNRARIIGMVHDPYDGSDQPAVADLAFDCPSPTLKQGESYLIDCTAMDTRNAMLSFTFRSAEPFKSTSKG